jgi:hypothetical protein
MVEGCIFVLAGGCCAICPQRALPPMLRKPATNNRQLLQFQAVLVDAQLSINRCPQGTHDHIGFARIECPHIEYTRDMFALNSTRTSLRYPRAPMRLVSIA